MNRRNLFCFGCVTFALTLLGFVLSGASRAEIETTVGVDKVASKKMTIHYLEIVTPEVDAICRTYEQLHGVVFSKPDASLGHARTARLPDGGLLGIRAPLRPTEQPIVRPYVLVEDIEASVANADASGAQIALPPMEIPGHGKCAIFIQGGAEHGLWEARETSE